MLNMLHIYIRNMHSIRLIYHVGVAHIVLKHIQRANKLIVYKCCSASKLKSKDVFYMQTINTGPLYGAGYCGWLWRLINLKTCARYAKQLEQRAADSEQWSADSNAEICISITGQKRINLPYGFYLTFTKDFRHISEPTPMSTAARLAPDC